MGGLCGVLCNIDEKWARELILNPPKIVMSVLISAKVKDNAC